MTGSIVFSVISTRRAPNAFCPSGSKLAVGDEIPIGRAGGFPVKAIEPFRSLVLAGHAQGVEWSWELALVPAGIGRTRLISRNRVRTPGDVRSRLTMLVIEPAAFVMTRKMLLGIKRRAEATSRRRKESRMTLPLDRTRATPREHLLALPGDELIRHAAGSLTHAITVHCNRKHLWPWLIQMGADRAGWYSYDMLDNGGRHSAERILQGLQHPGVGAVFPALPGRRDGFVLLESEPTHWLVLGWPAPDGELVVTWSFMLVEIDENTTRLIVRARASDDYRFHGLPKADGVTAGENGALRDGAQAAARDCPPGRAAGESKERSMEMIRRRIEMRPRRRSCAYWAPPRRLMPASSARHGCVMDIQPRRPKTRPTRCSTSSCRNTTWQSGIMSAWRRRPTVDVRSADGHEPRAVAAVRAIFKGRETAARRRRRRRQPGRKALSTLTKELGWVVLADMPGP